MKLSFLTTTAADIEKASRLGFDGVELDAGTFGDALEAALDVDLLDAANRACARHHVEVTALAYYDVSFRSDDFNRIEPGRVLAAYERVFDAAERLRVRTIASMSGFEPQRDWDGNLQLFAERFGPVAEAAEHRGLRIAIENWMGYWGRLPFRPSNMGGSPDTWDAWFGLVPSPALGLEFDPSHLYWQGIDHNRALREFKDRIFHVHAKDTEMLPERRYRGGVNGDYHRFRIPGYGAIDWVAFISTLDEIGYAGGVAIEHEDAVYSGDRYDEGLVRGWQVLHPLIHPRPVPAVRQP